MNWTLFQYQRDSSVSHKNLLKWLHAQQQNMQLFTCKTHRYVEEILMYICKQGITLDNNIDIPYLTFNVKDKLLKDMHNQICDKYVDAIALSLSEV